MSSIFNGKKLKKSELIFEALGDLDELNSFIGWAKVESGESARGHLEKIQDDIYHIMSLIGNEMKESAEIKKMAEEDVTFLEVLIEKMEGESGILRKFVKPGENEFSARIHICRSVCRRAERSVVALDELTRGDEIPLKYLNRLSDFLFLLAL